MTQNSPPRGRFAPSPSGRMHLGNVFCALLAYLAARSRGGRVVLRIEDLDPARSRREYAHQIEEDLAWLGLDWDEGGAKGGPCPPYTQSRCTALYQAVLEKLQGQGLLYPCFCSRAQLHAARAPHAADGQSVYDGRCRQLSAQEIKSLSSRHAPALRLRVPDAQWGFTDGVCGPYRQNLRTECGDFLVRRSDGVFAYQLAVVVDDARMGITHVVRGQDLLSSTPRQLYLYHLLGREAPAFFHVPLLTAPDGRRFSKREHDLDMGVLRRHCRPDEIIGALAALAGLLDKPRPALPRELIAGFAWDKVPAHSIAVPPDFLRKLEG
ncbi:MAG: tRNA glutamyl-Q(34) synthetase GluQRS [Eubacteriales bacterium]|nr:tRNA glutamyl-Q(34) synthetase GluQRS [Eubacteriales bacterium]